MRPAIKKTTTRAAEPHINPEKELNILRKIVDLTHSDLDLHRILNEVVKIVNEMASADSVFIFLLDEQRRHLNLLGAKGTFREELNNVRLKVGEGVAGWVAKENKPVVIKKKAYQDPRFKSFDFIPEDTYEAMLSVPITYKQKACGVINIQHKKPQEYPQALADLLVIIAKQVGGLIENARLFSENKTKAGKFDSLNKVSQSITSESYLDEILNLIVVVTAEMLNSKICSIMLLDKGGAELSIKATQSLSEEYKRKPNLKVNSSLMGEVVRTRRPMSVLDVRTEQKFVYRDLAVREHLCSMVAMPMIVKDKVIGVINVYTQETHEFTPEEISALQIVANQAAVAVENTKLMEEALRAKDALETRKLIERAKGILMRMNDLSEEAAYRMIHKKSMDTCRPMKEIAESLILMDEFRK